MLSLRNLLQVVAGPLEDGAWSDWVDVDGDDVESSVLRVKRLDAARRQRGHGEAFVNHRPLLDGLFAFYARRQERLLKKLANGPATVFELVHVLFPRVEPPRLYLMLSEVMGNLEVLEDAGKIRRIEEPDVFRFALA